MSAWAAALVITSTSSIWAVGVSTAARRANEQVAGDPKDARAWRWFYFPFLLADAVIVIAAAGGLVGRGSFWGVLALWTASTVVAVMLLTAARAAFRAYGRSSHPDST